MNTAHFFRTKYRRIAREQGTQHAAYLLRKMGVPVDVALEILVR
jgi:hypothetical protein